MDYDMISALDDRIGDKCEERENKTNSCWQKWDDFGLGNVAWDFFVEYLSEMNKELIK